MAVNPESISSRAKVETITHSLVCLRDTAMHGGHLEVERIPRNCWPPTDDEPFRYEFGAPPFLNFLSPPEGGLDLVTNRQGAI